MALPFYGYNRLTQGYGPTHPAYDIVSYPPQGAVPSDSYVRAVASGTVGQSTIITNKNDPTWEWGNYVRIDSDDGRHYVFYCHLASRLVSAGQHVNVGDPVGIMGDTGYSFGAHVHLEVRTFGTMTAVDPRVLCTEMPNAAGTVIQYNAAAPAPVDPFPGVSDEQLAARVWAGEFGVGDARKAALGSRYAAVQALVDKNVGKPAPAPIPEPTPAPAPSGKDLTIGREINLDGSWLYADAYTDHVSNTLPDPEYTGVVNPFYIHGAEINGRVPITNVLAYAAQEVRPDNTTGYISVSDVP